MIEAPLPTMSKQTLACHTDVAIVTNGLHASTGALSTISSISIMKVSSIGVVRVGLALSGAHMLNCVALIPFEWCSALDPQAAIDSKKHS
jgi:hypothetical protein